MTGEWEHATIEGIAARVAMGPFGSDIKTENFVASGVPVIRGNNLTSGRFRSEGFVFLTEEKADELANANAFPGDLVFTHRGTLGQVGLIPDKPFARYVVSQSQMKLTCDRAKADPLFLFYFFKSPVGQHALLMHTSQTGVPAISRPVTSLKGIQLFLPSLAEQRAIAHILGTLDDKIELSRRMSETLEGIARALFQSWYVDFDPVRAKTEGRDPGLPKNLADLFPARLVDSELGEIPEGWEVRSLGDIADLEKGLSYKGEGLGGEGGLPLVNLGCFAGGGLFKTENIKRYSGEYRPRHVVRAGDLVIANTDITQNRIIIGSPALLPTLVGEQDYLFSHHTFAVRFKPGSDRWKLYVYFSLLRSEFREIAEGYATGTTVLALPRDGVLRYQLVFPANDLLAIFERHVQVLLSKVEKADHENDTLSELRNALLPKLVSGDMRIGDAEKLIGRAM